MNDPQTEPAAPKNLQDARAILRRLGPAGPLAVIAATLPAINGFILLGVVAWVAPWLREAQPASLVAYVFGVTVLAGLAILPTYAQSLAAGWAFGFVSGGIAAVAGVTGAAALGYVVARRASGDRVVEMIGEHPKWKAVYDALIGGSLARQFLIVLLVRLPPNSPFSITNLAMAAAKVRPVTYLLGTMLGIAPRTLAAAWIGSRLERLDFSQKGSGWILIGGVFLTLVVVAIIGYLANQALAKVTAQAAENVRPTPADAGIASSGSERHLDATD